MAGAPMIAIRVKATENLCTCPACQLEGLLRDAGLQVDESAFDDAHEFYSAPAYVNRMALAVQ